jgi:uncharacterized protein
VSSVNRRQKWSADQQNNCHIPPTEVNMSVLRYDERDLWKQLERMPNRLRVAFAAACAQRQVPNYVRFTEVVGQGRPDVLIGALCCLWDDLLGRQATENDLQQQLDACMSLLPDEEDAHGRLAYYAEDAVSAAAYAIGARLRSDIQKVIWAAQMAYNALDEFACAEKPDSDAIDQKEEERIFSHLLVQAELRRQQVDLAQLQKIEVGSISEREGIAEVRRRAQADAREFFGSKSE